jgi:hypothetical protein
MSKSFVLVAILISQLFAYYCEDNYNFECSVDGTCKALYFSGCSEDWKNDSVIIRSLSLDVLWRMEEDASVRAIGLSTEVVDVDLRQGDSVYIEFYSNYGAWIRKIKVEDRYTNQSQFIQDE